MISKRKIVLLLIAIAIMGNSLLLGCDNTMDKIYNDNSKIAQYDTFGLDETQEIVEDGMYKGILKLSGTGTIWNYKSDKDFNLKVPYTLTVKSSKAKIVLISPDNRVITLAENIGKSAKEKVATLTIPIKKGDNRIKLVGYKKAKITVEMHIDKGEFQKIDF